MYIGYIYRLYCIGSVAYSSGGFTFVVEHIGIGCKDKHDHRQYYRIAASLCFPSLPTSYSPDSNIGGRRVVFSKNFFVVLNCLVIV